MDRVFLKNIRIDRICDFTGAYLKEQLFDHTHAGICDMKDIRGTNGYCSDEAAQRIRQMLKDLDPGGNHYLDDGNHHYMTLFWIEKIEEPFDLYVFDHHTDLQPPSLLPVLSCGGWILTAMEQVKLLKHVYLIGPPAESEKETKPYADRLTFISEEEANNGTILHPDNRPAYISVDLDVLSEKEFKSVWDQGSMTIERLEEWLSGLYSDGTVLGTDLCG